jgi:hypothetical protein
MLIYSSQMNFTMHHFKQSFKSLHCYSFKMFNEVFIAKPSNAKFVIFLTVKIFIVFFFVIIIFNVEFFLFFIVILLIFTIFISIFEVWFSIFFILILFFTVISFHVIFIFKVIFSPTISIFAIGFSFQLHYLNALELDLHYSSLIISLYSFTWI